MSDFNSIDHIYSMNIIAEIDVFQVALNIQIIVDFIVVLIC